MKERTESRSRPGDRREQSKRYGRRGGLGPDATVSDAANIQRDYPTNIRVTAAESGLARDTVFLAFQLRSLEHSRFTGPAAGSLSPTRMPEVANALRLTTDL